MTLRKALSVLFLASLLLLLGGPAFFAGFALCLVLTDNRKER